MAHATPVYDSDPFFLFPRDEDLGDIIELFRPLRMNNTVSSPMKVTSDLYGIGTVAIYPVDRTGERHHFQTTPGSSFNEITELTPRAFPEP